MSPRGVPCWAVPPPAPIPQWQQDYDDEHDPAAWRNRTEQEIKDEMERRIVVYFATPMRFAHRAQRRIARLHMVWGEVDAC
jgi:hypothetical protein